MAHERADVFADEDSLNLDRFTPKLPTAAKRPGPEVLQEIATRTKFVSREGRPAAEPPAVLRRRGTHRTGRTATVTLKTTPAASDQFYTIADEQGWKIGETFERALVALQRELERGGQGT